MIDRFDEILNELGNIYSVTLHPDKVGACKIQFPEQFAIQLECDPHLENLLVATYICEIPPGKFRENIFKDALKANHPFAQNGALAYSEKNNQLVLFSYLRLASLNGRKLSEFIQAFIEKASGWRTGVETGQTSQLVSQSSKSSGTIFDVK